MKKKNNVVIGLTWLVSIVGISSLSILLGSGETHASKLYNLNAPELSQALESLNTTYNLNLDIHVLNTGDPCANQQNYSSCIRKETDEGIDMVFVINNAIRNMETSVNDSALIAIPKADTLSFEQATVSYLQDNNEIGAIGAYLDEVKKYLDTQCNTYTVSNSNCTITQISTAKTLYQEKQAEDRAREKLKLMQGIFGLIMLSLLSIGTYKRRTTSQRNKKNNNILVQLSDHLKFLKLTISHDEVVYKDDKENLLTELASIDSEIESLLVSKPEWLDMKLQEIDYPAKLTHITEKYEEMLSIIGSSHEVLAQIEKVKSFDL